MEEQRGYFLLNVTGEVETGHFPGISDLYCKYCYVWGLDWGVVAGTEEGWSQTAKKVLDGEEDFVWNLPLDITFRSTNPQGWPQIVFSAYGLDYWGRDVVRGYGAVHLPMIPGRWTKRVAMFVPESASLLQRVGSWITGTRPEYVDPRVVAGSEGREVTRVRTQGFVTVVFNAVFKDFKELGYVSASSPLCEIGFPPPPSTAKLAASSKTRPAPQPPSSSAAVQQIQSDVEKMSLGAASAGRAETPSVSASASEVLPMAMEKTRPKPERRRKKSAPSADVLSNPSRQSMDIESLPGDG